MANPFAKTRPQHQPYAIYRAGDFIYHVCKTYTNKMEKPYARFFVWASSPFTHCSMEGGDMYAEEVLSNTRLVACEPEWLEVYGPRSNVTSAFFLPTPEEYIAVNATVEVN